jgi:GDP-mannose 6-dehydrogenase
VELIEALLGKGCAIRLYDRNVKVARLMGANQSYIEQHIPHIAALMCDSAAEVVASSDVIIIGNKAPEFAEAIRGIPRDKIVFDLVRVSKDRVSGDEYTGIAW